MSIVLEQLTKSFDGHPVVNQLSLQVGEGEFFVLLGPSGSGKSTVLRMIAGLTTVDSGRVFLHDHAVTDLPPQKRRVGFVFQHYALFGHMTVADNIEFPLKIRRVDAQQRRQRRDELLDLVGLVGFHGRYPQQLSGGQRQRVALARALAHQPDVLLLDEPFGALDAKIRGDLRRTVREIQRELKIATIFVTHDQEEAFELADRLGVMNFGHLLEVGPPDELYLRPETEFVATFLGAANLMVGQVTPAGIRLGPVEFPVGNMKGAAGAGRRVQVLFRPEDVAVKDAPEALSWPLLGKAVVEESSFVGSYERVLLRLPPLAGTRPIAPPAPFGGDSIRVEASRSQHQSRRFPLQPGDVAWVGVRRVHALTHPGLSVLILTDGSPDSKPAFEYGGQIAKRAHAHATLLAHGLVDEASARERLQAVREAIGGGLASITTRLSADGAAEAVAEEVSRRHYDLVVVRLPARGRTEFLERMLQARTPGLLLVPQERPVPSRILVCISIGEPAKEDVLFAARLVLHLGAEATILTVLPAAHAARDMEHARRFLNACIRTMGLLGVSAKCLVRAGDTVSEITAEVESGNHEMLVLGTPLADRAGRVRLAGVLRDVVARSGDRPLLLARAHEAVF